MNQQINILMLGSTGSGKKTLLRNAAQEFTQALTEFAELWTFNKTTFIIPHKPLESTETTPLPPIHGIALVFSLTDLLDKESQQKRLDEITTQLKNLKQVTKKLPIDLIVTHCDRILGFKEYFSNLNQEDRQRVLGFEHTEGSETLLKKLNSQIITRLHHETVTEKRGLIQLFPAQFEKAIENLNEFVTKLSTQSSCQIQNYYFTSSKQKDKSIDLLGTRATTMPPAITEKSYFVEHMILRLCQQAERCALKHKQRDKKRWIIIPSCIIILIALVTTWHYTYQKTATTLHSIELSLQQKTSQIQPNWLQRMDLLATTIQKLNQPSLRYSRFIGFNQASKLKKKLVEQYHTQLLTEFLPYIEGILTKTLINGMQHDKLALYNSLKIYLMLTTQTHYDKNTIINWFALYWSDIYKNDPQRQQQMLDHLNNLLALKNKNWPRNQPLISQAQTALQELPAADLIFLKLQGQYKNQQQSLASLIKHSSNLDLSQAIIPSLFSADNFKHIYNEQIPELVANFSMGDWVIGKSTDATSSPDKQATIIAEVRALYLQYFSSSWEKTLSAIRLTQPQNFSDVQNAINELTNPHSSMMELLKFVIGNATLSKQLQPDTALSELSQFTQQNATYTETKTALSRLSIFLKPIVSSDDVNKESFNTTIAILNNQLPNNPLSTLNYINVQSPLKNWLHTIAVGCWKILLKNSAGYLNTVWSSIVLPSYTSDIAHRFPIDSESQSDISLTSFANFFGPDGTMDVFFNYYLKPFVNMKNNYWTWKPIEGQTIPIDQSILDTVMRASLIQQMFYTDDNQQPSFKFSLTPFTKSANLRSIHLSIEGQSQLYDNTHAQRSIFTWPGPAPDTVTIRAEFFKGSSTHREFKGPWALFRFIQFAQLSMMDDPQKFILQIKMENGLAAYHLIADNRINPFIPGVLNKFNCPQQL